MLLSCLFAIPYLFVQQVFFAIVVGSSSLGSALPELQTFSVALGSATTVFAVLKRVRYCMRNSGPYCYNFKLLGTRNQCHI